MDEKQKRSTGKSGEKRENDRKKQNRKAIIRMIVLLAIIGIVFVFAYMNNISGNVGYNSPTPGVTMTPSATPAQTGSATPKPTPSVTPTPVPTLGPDEDRRSTRTNEEPVKALYLNPTSVRSKVDHYIDLANKTEINAYVIDIKDDDGTIMYDSSLPDVNAAKGDTPDFDIRTVIKKMHDNNIRVIARMVTFKDNTITKLKPDLALKTANGEPFKMPAGKTTLMWLDATNKAAWDYVVSVAKEAINFGFDEIQFDYIRFPETSLYKYQLNLEPGKERHDYIEGFIRYARSSLPPDIVLSADIFGMPLIASKDYGEIGQTLESIGKSLDYICPMVYPSHFANNAKSGAMSNGVGQTINGITFTHPDLKPYDVIYNTLFVGKSRVEKVEGYNLKMRPYIQGFTASYIPAGYWMQYTADVYKAEIKAVYDAGYNEWIFWNAPNDYVESGFAPE